MKNLHAPIIAMLLVVFAFIMVQVGKQQQLYQMRQTYSICMKSHNEINGTSEQACGREQDKTHTEFVCGKDLKYCWLEVK